jgi:phosphoribosyl-ATP pyrophosphohydrolase
MKTFDQLFAELLEKIENGDLESSSVAAVKGGVHNIGKKILEEAGEVWLAAEHESNEALAQEISQLIYHLQILMLARGITPSDIYRYL